MLKPKYSVMVQVYTFPGRLHFYFSRPIDSELMNDLKRLEQDKGFELTQIIGMTNKPWCLSFPPTYDALDVASHIEEMLNNHGHNQIRFKCDVIGDSHESLTVSELKQKVTQ